MICSFAFIARICRGTHLQPPWIFEHMRIYFNWLNSEYVSSKLQNELSRTRAHTNTHDITWHFNSNVSNSQTHTWCALSSLSLSHLHNFKMLSLLLVLIWWVASWFRWPFSIDLSSISNGFYMLQATLRIWISDWVDLFSFVYRLPSVSSILNFGKWKMCCFRRCSFFHFNNTLCRSDFYILTLSISLSLHFFHFDVISGLFCALLCFFFIFFVSIALGSFLMIVN